MAAHDANAIQLLRLAATGNSDAVDTAESEPEPPRDPDPELPVEVANAREQQLLLAYRRICNQDLARVVVELVDTVAARRGDG